MAISEILGNGLQRFGDCEVCDVARHDGIYSMVLQSQLRAGYSRCGAFYPHGGEQIFEKIE